MNERIKFLKHQASVWCDENIPEQYSEETNGYGKAWEDKFAELIVRECAETIQDFVDHRFPASEYPNRLKQYFGVEE